MNMYGQDPDDNSDLAGFFQALGQPARLQLLAALSEGEACVCHLEALSGQRQAYISQQLRVLRMANLVNQRRAGKHMYYSIASPEIMNLVQAASALSGLSIPDVSASLTLPVPGCTCPACLEADRTAKPRPETSMQAG